MVCKWQAQQSLQHASIRCSMPICFRVDREQTHAQRELRRKAGEGYTEKTREEKKSVKCVARG